MNALLLKMFTFYMQFTLRNIKITFFYLVHLSLRSQLVNCVYQTITFLNIIMKQMENHQIFHIYFLQKRKETENQFGEFKNVFQYFLHQQKYIIGEFQIRF